ncbi:basic proline-rich protein-like [Perognathus longimembris pacificus]|uniref:basic proline-rich protein-like n=1 Tax=Perognathus longimembris pacificus TaxID=214514 RepID=UPI002018BE32|nr:basic proline-rich protein-like [Perognathus longimembris pacificus]
MGIRPQVMRSTGSSRTELPPREPSVSCPSGDIFEGCEPPGSGRLLVPQQTGCCSRHSGSPAGRLRPATALIDYAPESLPAAIPRETMARPPRGGLPAAGSSPNRSATLPPGEGTAGAQEGASVSAARMSFRPSHPPQGSPSVLQASPLHSPSSGSRGSHANQQRELGADYETSRPESHGGDIHGAPPLEEIDAGPATLRSPAGAFEFRSPFNLCAGNKPENRKPWEQQRRDTQQRQSSPRARAAPDLPEAQSLEDGSAGVAPAAPEPPGPVSVLSVRLSGRLSIPPRAGFPQPSPGPAPQGSAALNKPPPPTSSQVSPGYRGSSPPADGSHPALRSALRYVVWMRRKARFQMRWTDYT